MTQENLNAKPDGSLKAGETSKFQNNSEILKTRLAQGRKSFSALQKEIACLRAENAEYKKRFDENNAQNIGVQEEIANMRQEVEKYKKENAKIKKEAVLKAFGCVESEFLAGVIPEDVEDIEKWAQNYKEAHPALFKGLGANFGMNFKPSSSKNLTQNQRINNFIRNSIIR